MKNLTSDRLKKIAEKKEKLEQKERVLKQKNRKIQIRKFIEIGTLAAKFGLDNLDNEVLLGAFAEIEEKAKDSPIIEQWKKKALLLKAKQQLRLIISFAQSPSEELKKALKCKNFRCNEWRKELYGFGLKEELEELVSAHTGKVEVVEG